MILRIKAMLPLDSEWYISLDTSTRMAGFRPVNGEAEDVFSLRVSDQMWQRFLDGSYQGIMDSLWTPLAVAIANVPRNELE